MAEVHPTVVKRTSNSRFSTNSSRSLALDRHSAHSNSDEREEKKKKKRSWLKKDTTASDSDESEDDSFESEEPADPAETKITKASRRKNREWEILEGLKDGQKSPEKPDKYESYLMKRRKWPMKGWHKRFFVLERGILTYAKSPSDLQKGKYHGTVDIGLSVLTFKKHGHRIDIDAEDTIYHLKVKAESLFKEWVTRFGKHRLYRQHEIAFGTTDAPKLTGVASPVDDFTPVTSPISPHGSFSERTHGSFKGRPVERTQSKVAAWLLDSHGMEVWSRDLNGVQARIFELGTLLEKLKEASSPTSSQASTESSHLDLAPPPHPKKEKSSRKLSTPSKSSKLHKERKSSDKLLTVPNGTSLHQSTSNPAFAASETAEPWPSGNETRPAADNKLREDFFNAAKSAHNSLRVLSRSMGTERERLKHAMEHESSATLPSTSQSYVQSLRQRLNETLKQNADYRARLNRISAEANITTTSPPQLESPSSTMKITRGNLSELEHPLVAASMSWESQSEFYDAPEFIGSSGSSSEGSDEDEENSSDISESEYTALPSNEASMALQQLQTGRRSKLPAPKPDTDISLWSLLCKNIGKDLSKISMPVTLNEPLSMLQRLCEELEYSELIDKAADTQDPYERMVLVAAFTVSPYAATYYRAGQKPFNPLLGETYECIREDKGWRFVGEQVSHHPPVSACYCESKNFMFWQDTRIKTKFWGKSMEVQPLGTVSLKLPKFKELYTWNKATTCVHNLLGGQRWVDHYGEVLVTNHTLGIKCKLTYAKSSYWSEKRHEVYGSVTNAEGKVVQHLFGKWNEGIYFGHAPSAKCVWRPGSMPEDFDIYYGFTRFAIELNEVDPDQVHLYCPTDTRFRSDQRKLEEGSISGAESEKQKLEQGQRERRKKREEEKVQYSPRWFLRTEENKKEVFMYTGKYWELRKDPGFLKMSFDKLF